jgi:hypothetical protein
MNGTAAIPTDQQLGAKELTQGSGGEKKPGAKSLMQVFVAEIG